jgi:PAS domain S-box-containing protein
MNNQPMPSPAPKKKIILELVIVLSAGAAFYLVASTLDLFEWFADFSRRYEGWNLDEVVIAVVFLAFALGAFSFRRWREQTREVVLRRQTEAQLADSESKYRALFDNSIEGICILSEGKALFANPRALEISGYSLEEILSKPFVEFLHPDDRERAMDSHVKRLRGEDPPQGLQLRLISKSGGIMWIEAYGSLVTWQGKPATLNLIHDITKRKLAEEALQRTEQSYESLFNGISDWICAHDMEGIITDVNKSVLDASGYTRDELIGVPMAKLIPPKFRQGFYDDYMKTLREQGHAEGIVRYQSKDGRQFFVEYRNSLVKGHNGVIYASCAGRDISERVEQTRKMKKLEQQLRQSQKMEAVGTLAGGIAHDFNNILQAVVGYIDLISSTKGLSKPILIHLSHINSAARRAAELVKQLLMFSRQVEPTLVPLDVNERVWQSVKLLERIIPKMIHLKTNLDDDLKMVQGDIIQVEQVLLNLGTNARDAMPRGGELFIETQNIYLDEAFCQNHLDMKPGEYVKLKVSDTGEGIEPKALEHIFDPFFTTKGVGEGTGLGLATTYGIVKGHGGHIFCKSQPGRGTSFEIYLPALDEGSTQAVEPEEDWNEEEYPVGDETVLVVDDEWTIINAIQEGFKKQGFQVISAESGERALELYKERGDDVDLVILDVGMPGMGGVACIKELKKIHPGIKLIISSGYATESQVEEALKAGAMAYVAKPYRLLEMLTKARDVLDDTDKSDSYTW